MDNDFVGWMYLQQLVGNFEGLYHYYFQAVYSYAPWFRQAAVSIIYTLGLAWAGLCFIKAPVDRFQAGCYSVGMVVLCGFLLSPTTDTKHLGPASGQELSRGAYYSFLISGTMTDIFSSVLRASWKNSIVQAAGGGAPSVESLTMSFNDRSQQFADKYIKGEGSKAYVDYYTQCAPSAVKYAKTPKEQSIIKSIGLGAATLGMEGAETSTMVQSVEKQANQNTDYGLGYGTGSGDLYAGSNLLQVAVEEAKAFEANKRQGATYLKNLPDSGNKLSGTTGYKIPTSDFYKTVLSDKTGTSQSTADSFKSLSSAGSEFATMLPKGAQSVAPGSEEDYTFYPKNCYELYLVANETMKSLRQGSKGVPGYEKMPLAGSFVSMSMANKVNRGVHDQLAEIAKQAGIDIDVDQSAWDKIANNAHGALSEIGNEYNEFMLQFKIPAMIAAMAMLICALLITFPVFALLAVVFGHKVLITYLKLMALPFLVVFINHLLLSLSADLIAFNKQAALFPEMFNPGGVDVAGSMSGMNTETIVFSLICGAELVVAKLLLWDDVRSATNWNFDSLGTASAGRGGQLLAAAASFVAGGITRGARVASAAKNATSAKSANTHIANISNAVQKIANGSRDQQKSQFDQRGGSKGTPSATSVTPSPAGGGGNTGGGGNAPANSPLNPPKP